jgi:hypothetical protein
MFPRYLPSRRTISQSGYVTMAMAAGIRYWTQELGTSNFPRRRRA